MLPSRTPSGTPITPAMTNACSVRLTEARKSPSKGPPAMPLASATNVAPGGQQHRADQLQPHHQVPHDVQRQRTDQRQQARGGPGSRGAGSLRRDGRAGAGGCAPARLEVIASMAQPLYSIEATSTFWAKMPLSANRSKNFWKYWISLGLNSL